MAVETATDAKVDALRAQLPAVQTTGYFNTGSNGPIPIVAFEAADAIARRELLQGDRSRRVRREPRAQPSFRGDGGDHLRRRRRRDRPDPQRHRRTGHGAHGNDLDPGTKSSPPRGAPRAHVAARAPRSPVWCRHPVRGYRRRRVRVVEALASRITSRTRVIAVSHVLWSTGAVLPLREISALARQHELMVVVDGAQSAGQVPVDLHAMGIDAYAMAGQKWLCGPEATGLLYVRGIALRISRRPTPATGNSSRADISSPRRARCGTRSASSTARGGGPGGGAALAARRSGFDWAYDRIAALGADFRSRLTSIDGVTVITPSEPMAGLVNFTVDGLSHKR